MGLTCGGSVDVRKRFPALMGNGTYLGGLSRKRDTEAPPDVLPCTGSLAVRAGQSASIVMEHEA
jgi:hypothetical protein